MNQTEESRALDQLADRLRARFPDAPRESVKNLVEQAHRQYDGRPVRDYVPVLVEREVVEHFRFPEQRRP